MENKNGTTTMLAASTITPRLQNIVDKIDDLPTLPTVVIKMMELIGKSETSVSELSKLIATDPVLMAKLLKIANSSFYGFPRQISTLDTARGALGFSQLQGLGLSLSVAGQFSPESNNDQFDLKRFWEHSAGCGIASRMLAKIYGNPSGADAFAAGLLHDIGIFVIFRYFPLEFDEILLLVNNGGMSLMAAERALIDVTQSEIGQWLAETWNMPAELVDGIPYHHPADAEDHPEIAMLVHLSDIICRMFHMGSDGDELVPEISQDAIAVLSKKHPMFHTRSDLNLESYEARFSAEAEEFEAFLNLIRAA